MKKLLLVLTLLFFLSGCWDKHEIEEQAFVIAIGVDKGQDPQSVKVTYLVANPPVGLPNAGGDREPAEQIITLSVPGYISGRDLANATETRKLNFSHAKVIVVGSKFAKSKNFFQFMRGTVRDIEIRRAINLIISKEDASDFLNRNQPQLETRPHKYYDLMSSRWKETGLVPYSTIQKYFEKVQGNSDAFLSILASTKKIDLKDNGDEDSYKAGQVNQEGGNKTEMIGSAVVRDGRMIASLNGEETRIALNLRPRPLAKYMWVTYPDPIAPKYRIEAKLTHVRPTTIHMNVKKNPLEITIVVPMELYVGQITSGINYVTNYKNQAFLKKTIEEDLEKMMSALVEKTQKKYKIDLFDWSLIARKKFMTRQAFEKFDWRHQYPDAKVNIEVNLKIEGFGNQLEPPNINSKGG